MYKIKKLIKKTFLILLILYLILALSSCKNTVKVEKEFSSETTVIETVTAIEIKEKEIAQNTIEVPTEESKTEDDVTKLNPSLIGNYSTDIISGNGNISRANYRDIKLFGNSLFLGYYVYDKKTDKNYYGFKVLDITNQTNIEEIGDYVQINKFWELVGGISEDYIYITNGSDGFQIIDITNKKPPIVVGIFKTPQSAMYGIVKEDHAYVADVNGL
jgi:hypothetical protein